MNARLPFVIVGIGASAGGVEALQTLFRTMPRDSGMAFVIANHFPADRESMLPSILGRVTGIPVTEARNGEEIEPDRVYSQPSGMVIAIKNGRFQLRRPPSVVQSDPQSPDHRCEAG